MNNEGLDKLLNLAAKLLSIIDDGASETGTKRLPFNLACQALDSVSSFIDATTVLVPGYGRTVN